MIQSALSDSTSHVPQPDLVCEIVGNQGRAAGSVRLTCTSPAESQWSLADKIAVGGVGITLVSAVIALIAIRVAAAALRAQLAAPKAERRHSAYYALVAQPAMEIVPATIRDAIHRLEDGASKIERAVTGQEDAAAVRAAYYAAKKAYAEALWPLMHRLAVASRAWGVKHFHDDVTASRFRLEDDVWPQLMKFTVGEGDHTAMIEAIHSAESALLARIIHYDPTNP